MSADQAANSHQLNDIDRLIHEPARYNIMALLYVVKRADFLFVQNHTGLTPGNLSTHVGKLESAEYLVIEKEFVGKKPKTFLSVGEKGKRAFEEYRTRMRNLFTTPPPVPTPDHSE